MWVISRKKFLTISQDVFKCPRPADQMACDQCKVTETDIISGIQEPTIFGCTAICRLKSDGKMVAPFHLDINWARKWNWPSLILISYLHHFQFQQYCSDALSQNLGALLINTTNCQLPTNGGHLLWNNFQYLMVYNRGKLSETTRLSTPRQFHYVSTFNITDNHSQCNMSILFTTGV